MRPWIAIAAKLYPRRWRERYGAEFDALMQDVEPDWREFANVLGGAMKMQLRSETAYWKLAAVMAAIGAVVALGVSLRVPERFVSTAVLRVTPPPPDERAVYDIEALRQPVLSRNQLAELIQRPALDLYRAERRMMPVEDVIERMRHDIQITRDGDTVSVAFTYPDREKARNVVRELTTRFLESNITSQRNRQTVWRMAWKEDAPPGPQLLVLTSASDPRPLGANRLIWALAGIAAGMFLAALWRWPRVVSTLTVFTASGCIIGGAASYTIAPRYTSAAIMHITPPYDMKRWYAGRAPEPVENHVHRIASQVLRTENLEKLMLRPRLQLYQQERARQPIAEVAQMIRERDARIEVISPSRFRISFTYENPFIAQAVVREFVSETTEAHYTEERRLADAAGGEIQFMATHKIGENVEVLDPATLPIQPVSPDRLAMAAIGAGAGLLLGLAFVLFRRLRDGSMAGAVPAAAV